MNKHTLLNMAGLVSMADIKTATDQMLVHLILSRHYLAGMAARELEIRLCRS